MNPQALDQFEPVFQALADPQRRHILQRLIRNGAATATRLAKDMPISRQAIVKHLETLDRAELVTSRKAGRDVLFLAQPARLEAAGSALQQIGAVWTETLTALKREAERHPRG